MRDFAGLLCDCGNPEIIRCSENIDARLRAEVDIHFSVWVKNKAAFSEGDFNGDFFICSDEMFRFFGQFLRLA